MNSKNHHKSVAFTVMAAALIGLAANVSAATYTFTGGGATDNWSDPDNWLLGLIPANDGTADVVLSGTATTSNIDQTWSVASITQALGANYTLSTTPGATVSVGTEFDNLGISPLVISGSVANSDSLVFNSGTFDISGSAGTGGNVSINSAAQVYVTSTGTLTSSFGAIAVGSSSAGSPLGLLGGTGSISAKFGAVTVRGPDGGPFAPGPGPTLYVGTPGVNGGVGTLSIDTPAFAANSGGDTLDFQFGGGNHSQVMATGSFSLFNNANFGGTPYGDTFDITSNDSSTTPGVYTLVSYTGAAIDSATLAAQSLNLPAGWEGNLISSDGILALDLTSTGVVPEPQTWALLGGGFTVLVVILRRKASRQA